MAKQYKNYQEQLNDLLQRAAEIDSLKKQLKAITKKSLDDLLFESSGLLTQIMLEPQYKEWSGVISAKFSVRRSFDKYNKRWLVCINFSHNPQGWLPYAIRSQMRDLYNTEQWLFYVELQPTATIDDVRKAIDETILRAQNANRNWESLSKTIYEELHKKYATDK